ncbi:hypothetical protein [uncultured Clostridium sp.]|uniref:hypothetical protein n=1 Tax=uncultured Clostridium sp. TaxID=59620 RepID=UPI00261C0EA7|nr:hypothetical protein [uncultured Clostridium sp.]
MKNKSNFFDKLSLKTLNFSNGTISNSKDNLLIFIGVLWLACGLLRETTLINYLPIRFFLGIAPNLFAPFLFFVFFKNLFFKKSICTKRDSIIIITSIFVLGFISEIIHHFFINSPFDIFDMIATLLASITIYLIYNKNS